MFAHELLDFSKIYEIKPDIDTSSFDFFNIGACLDTILVCTLCFGEARQSPGHLFSLTKNNCNKSTTLPNFDKKHAALNVTASLDHVTLVNIP